jgi:hypothetical protein
MVMLTALKARDITKLKNYIYNQKKAAYAAFFVRILSFLLIKILIGFIFSLRLVS